MSSCVELNDEKCKFDIIVPSPLVPSPIHKTPKAVQLPPVLGPQLLSRKLGGDLEDQALAIGLGALLRSLPCSSSGSRSTFMALKLLSLGHCHWAETALHHRVLVCRMRRQ